MNLPLAGVRVLDLTRLLPGSYCTTMLADLGARVVKVEEPELGDYGRWQEPFHGSMSYYHLLLNRNKESMRLNLKHPQGLQVFRRLVPNYDVIIEGFRPGVVARLGIDYEAMRPLNPALVYCSLSGFGQTGPYAQQAGHDINYLARSGALSLMPPSQDGTPALPAIFTGDLSAAMWMAFGVVAALRQAERTGRGEYLDISIHDVAISLLTIHAGQHFAAASAAGDGAGGSVLGGIAGEGPAVEGAAPGDTGSNVARNAAAPALFTGAAAPYNVFVTLDGQYITLGAFEPHFWQRFCDLVHRPDLKPFHLQNPDRRDWVLAEVKSLFRTRTRAEWEELFFGHDICFAPVKSMAEVFGDPHVLARQMVYTHVHPDGGTIPQLGHPIKYAGMQPQLYGPAPPFGAHTRAVLSEAGFSEQEITDLASAGVIGFAAGRG